MVSFPIKGDPDGASFIAWTTTPWTLPSNLALCVNAELTYVKVGARVCAFLFCVKVFILAQNRQTCICLCLIFLQAKDPVRNKVFIVAQSRLPFMPGAVPKESKGKGKDKDKEG